MAIKMVIFHWSDEHGKCSDCGRPAAFFDSIDQRLCALCAANAAADGDIIRWIERP